VKSYGEGEVQAVYKKGAIHGTYRNS